MRPDDPVGPFPPEDRSSPDASATKASRRDHDDAVWVAKVGSSRWSSAPASPNQGRQTAPRHGPGHTLQSRPQSTTLDSQTAGQPRRDRRLCSFFVQVEQSPRLDRGASTIPPASLVKTLLGLFDVCHYVVAVCPAPTTPFRREIKRRSSEEGAYKRREDRRCGRGCTRQPRARLAGVDDLPSVSDASLASRLWLSCRAVCLCGAAAVCVCVSPKKGTLSCALPPCRMFCSDPSPQPSPSFFSTPSLLPSLLCPPGRRHHAEPLVRLVRVRVQNAAPRPHAEAITEPERRAHTGSILQLRVSPLLCSLARVRRGPTIR